MATNSITFNNTDCDCENRLVLIFKAQWFRFVRVFSYHLKVLYQILPSGGLAYVGQRENTLALASIKAVSTLLINSCFCFCCHINFNSLRHGVFYTVAVKYI